MKHTHIHTLRHTPPFSQSAYIGYVSQAIYLYHRLCICITGYAQPDRKDHLCCTVYHIGYAQPLYKKEKEEKKEDQLCTLQHLQ